MDMEKHQHCHSTNISMRAGLDPSWFRDIYLGPRSTPPLDPEGNPIYFRDRDGEPFEVTSIRALAELIFLCLLLRITAIQASFLRGCRECFQYEMP